MSNGKTIGDDVKKVGSKLSDIFIFRWIGKGIKLILWFALITIIIFTLYVTGKIGVNAFLNAQQSGQAGSLVQHGTVAAEVPKQGIESFIYSVLGAQAYAWYSGDMSRQSAFQSEVVQNENTRLGFFIKDYSPDIPQVFEDQPVTFTGTITASSLAETTSFRVYCKTEDYQNNQPIPAQLYGSNTVNVNQAVVYKGIETEFEAQCNIKGLQIKNKKSTTQVQSKVSTLILLHNFMTEASQKVYFADINKMSNLQGRDPFVAAGIRDSDLGSNNKIKSRTTAGPLNVAVGIDLPQPFESNRPYPLTVSLTNNIGWTGNPQKIEDVTLVVPNAQDLKVALEGTSGYGVSSVTDTCDFELYDTDSDRGVDIYKVKQEKLDFINQDCSDKTIKTLISNEKKCIDFLKYPVFRCNLKAIKVPQNLQWDNLGVTVNYIYKNEKSTVIDIRRNPEEIPSSPVA